MKVKKIMAAGVCAVVAVFAIAGCAMGLGGRSPVSEPTITAILLPTRTSTQIAQVVATAPAARPTQTLAASPTRTPAPTATASPEPTATTPPEPTRTATTTAAASLPTPTEEPTATGTAPATAAPKPTRAQPKPTAVPEFSGKLVFQTTIGGEFYTINADGSGLRRITDGVDPIWSPDGKRIAFTRWREPRGVWVVNANGSGEQRVFDWNSARWPSWSPDGSQILFSRQHGGRTEDAERCFFGFCFDIPAKPHWRLGRVELGDGSFSEPPSPLYSLAPDWSPDGKQIVYAGEHGLVIQTVDGEVSYQITNDGRDTGPVWSPDGKRVAFTRRQHDHWELYVVDADGRNLTRLTDTPERPNGQPGSSAAPAWSPDGKSIAFFTDRTGTWEIWVMRANGSQQKPMFKSALKGLALEYGSVGDRAISWTR
jgi:TolB protein